MLPEKLPHDPRGVDIPGGVAGNNRRYRLPAGPGVPAAADGVENHVSRAAGITHAAGFPAGRKLLWGFIAAIPAG